MRNLKKVLVMVLALAMMLSIMVVGAGAVPEAFTDASDIDGAHKEAVEMATQLNIIEGFPDKSFQPKGDVTRAQISKMICIAINGGEVPATAVKADPSYNDIKGHWAEGFIEYCTAKGIIAGYPDGSFKPEQPVTGAEAAKMMLVALGYNADVEQYVGEDWDLYVNVQANQDGLYVDLLDVADLTTTNLSREHTAQMVWNMLQAFTVKASNSIDRSTGAVTQNYSKSDDTLFWESYRAIFADGQMVGFKHSDGKWTYYVDFGDEYYVRDEAGKHQTIGTIAVKSTQDYSDWLGHDVKVAFNADNRNASFKSGNNTAYGIFHDSGTVLAEALFGDLGKIQPGDDTVEINGTAYRMNAGDGKVTQLPVYQFYNGERTELMPYEVGTVTSATTVDSVVYTITSNQKDENGNAITYTVTVPTSTSSSVTPYSLYFFAGQYSTSDNWKTQWDHQKFQAIDEDEDGKIDFLIVKPYSVAQVSSVNGSKVGLNVVVDNMGNVGNFKTFLEDAETYDGIKRDDWVVYTAPQNNLNNEKAVIVKADMISGEITKANDRTPKDSALATIDGTQYTFSYYFDQTMGTASELCKVGNKLSNAVVYNNYIFAVDNVKKAAITDYALVTALGDAEGVYGAQAKLLFWDKTSKIVDTDIDYTKVDDIDVGTLVIYSKNADGEYILDAAEVGNNDYVIDWAVYDGVNKSNNSDNVGALEGVDARYNGNYAGKATINDDAVVFVRYQKDAENYPNDFSYKVITGKQLKMNDWQYIVPSRNEEINSLILGSRYNNVNYVELAYVDIAPKLTDAEAQYAYILDGANGMETSETRGDTVKALDLWTADGFQHKQFAGTIKCLDEDGYNIVTEYGDTKYKALEPGMVIKYTTNDAGDISEILGFYDVDRSASFNDGVNALTVAISSLNPIAFDYAEGIDYERTYGNTTVWEWKYWDTTDATILYVDNTKQEGFDASGNSLYTAVKHEGDLVANAMIIFNDKGVVDLIVVDVDNEITQGRPLTSQAN